MSLPVDGRKDRLDRDAWLRFAAYCQLSEKAAVRILSRQASVVDEGQALVARSFLPADQKVEYKRLLADRTTTLMA